MVCQVMRKFGTSCSASDQAAVGEGQLAKHVRLKKQLDIRTTTERIHLRIQHERSL